MKKNLKGISVLRVGQPGNASIVNRRHKLDRDTDELIADDDRFDLIFELAVKIKELEELRELKTAQETFEKVQRHYDFQNLSNAASGITVPGMNGSRVPYYEARGEINSGYGDIRYCQKLAMKPYEFVGLRAITQNEILHHPPPV